MRHRRRAAVFHLPGPGGRRRGGADYGEFLHAPAAVRCGGHRSVSGLSTTNSVFVRRQRRHLPVCQRLYDHLPAWFDFCYDRAWYESIYQHAGVWTHWDDDCRAGSSCKHCAGSGVYFWAEYGSAGGGLGHGFLPGQKPCCACAADSCICMPAVCGALLRWGCPAFV